MIHIEENDIRNYTANKCIFCECRVVGQFLCEGHLLGFVKFLELTQELLRAIDKEICDIHLSRIEEKHIPFLKKLGTVADLFKYTLD